MSVINASRPPGKREAKPELFGVMDFGFSAARSPEQQASAAFFESCGTLLDLLKAFFNFRSRIAAQNGLAKRGLLDVLKPLFESVEALIDLAEPFLHLGPSFSKVGQNQVFRLGHR